MTRIVKVRCGRDAESREIIYVPLRNKGEAILYREDFDRLLELGLSLSWNRLPNGYVTAPAYKAHGNSIQVARVIVDAGPGEQVKYVNGDLTDLRSSNLCLLKGGGASRRDRDFISARPRLAQVEYLDAA